MKPEPVTIGSKWIDKGGRIWEVYDIERRPFGYVSIVHKTLGRCLQGDVYHRNLRANYTRIQEP